MSETGVATNLIGSGTPPPTPPTNGAEPPKTLIGDPPKEGEQKTEAAPVAPLTFEQLKFPEGVEVDKEMATGLLGVLNDQTLTPEARAQGLVDLHLKAIDSASEKASAFYRELQDTWVGEAVKEFGGEEKLKPVLGGISRLIDEYGGTPEQRTQLRDAFALTGAGNNPRMVAFLHSIAQKLVTEGRPTGGAPQGAGQRSAAEILYPNMTQG